MRNIKKYEVGSTVKFTWISSGSTASPCISSILEFSDPNSPTVVSSLTATSSGDGHYYANHPVPNTPGYYVNQWLAVVGVNTYISRQRFQAIRTEVQ